MSRRNLTTTALVVTIALAGCATSRTDEPRTEQPRIVHQEPWTPTPTGELVGRVTLDGQPVPYFGVSMVVAKISNSLPDAVRSADGRFAITLPRGTWDLIFAGPGFARTVVPNVTIAESGNAPLEVAVTHGYTIDGTVVDPVGNPVGSAAVRIHQGLDTHSRNILWRLEAFQRRRAPVVSLRAPPESNPLTECRHQLRDELHALEHRQPTAGLREPRGRADVGSHQNLPLAFAQLSRGGMDSRMSQCSTSLPPATRNRS
jgi:hypothetical protein